MRNFALGQTLVEFKGMTTLTMLLELNWLNGSEVLGELVTVAALHRTPSRLGAEGWLQVDFVIELDIRNILKLARLIEAYPPTNSASDFRL